ncbi:MAG: DNA-directed RNA polymerase subunit beta [Nitrospinae bacterium]|nr:DNA-directed RNA polymerase subunit beta [Nitrospinota bacterium]
MIMKNFIQRKDFSRIPAIIDIPNLIEVQKKSYNKFLQSDVTPVKRENSGLEEVFRSVFPISNYKETASIEYIGYEVGIWDCDCGEYKGLGGEGLVCAKCKRDVLHKEKYSVEECRQKGMTYADPLKVMVQLVVKEKDEKGNSTVREIKEQKIYLGEIPLMTETGTFIINGIERVIVSQMHRSPGVFFFHDKSKSHSIGKITYSARLIPYRGSWLDFEFDTNEILYVRIDRRRKLPATILLRALGYSTEEILSFFYESVKVNYHPESDIFSVRVTDLLIGQKAKEDIIDPSTGECIVKAQRKINKAMVKRIESAKIKSINISPDEMVGKIIANDVVDEMTGEILLEINTDITSDMIEIIKKNKIKEFSILHISEQYNDTSLRDTLLVDKINTPEEALREIYKRLRPGEPPTIETARLLFKSLFFNPKRYDLSEVGRLKLNNKLGLNLPLSQRQLTAEDIIATVKYLLNLRLGIGSSDDIDHLGNRRVRAIGESLENQLRIGLIRMERAIIERMNIQDIETAMPYDLINSKPVTAAIKEFYGSSQLSQFMDQTNPLSEITHKRRLSALGPGGLTRERAGFEVRDVHPTHYGRICPIETPEGPNIGLIASLSTYSKVNEFGFIETPYRKVKNGRVTDEVIYLSAMEEEGFTIAQANAPIDSKGNFETEMVSARKGGEFIMVSPDKIDYMDVSPKQLVSVAASLIPFLEHDDANRALMGSNMQRQAVPLLRTEAPLVGTGMERIVARDSGAAVLSRSSGDVLSVDANRIVILADMREKEKKTSKVDIYNLVKYQRSNQNTCINQKPLVTCGDRVKKGDVIADGPATDRGDLALGHNVLVAFMPWEGFNFEDAIIVSERLVKEDKFTSIHIEEFEIEARDTKQGKEEITGDIPNISKDVLKDLDESGIIRIGAKVKPDDILVGKITPKGESILSPEEKLLKAIFGEKAGDVRDTSLRVPPGIEGTIIGVKVFSRKGMDKDSRALTIEEEDQAKLMKDYEEEIEIIKDERDKKLRNLLVGKTAAKDIKAGKRLFIQKKKKMTEDILNELTGKDLLNIEVVEADIKDDMQEIEDAAQDQIHAMKTLMNEKISKLKKGDELSPGVIKLVKVFVATKRKLSVGDKMAGRHGNKGVVAKNVPEEDMPYLEDGTPVDIILNPLGVPSRMNVGQILETNLGMAAQKLGIYVASPVFDGAREGDIKELLKEAGFSETGKTVLYDGRTGKTFDQKVVVGYIYMMKLHHLVDDKIHARSTGPYSLVTQQPLGGKAQFGGQRLGEMEVWSLESYGAAYTLQEMLTVKSDDVEGRKRIYEAIVKGDNTLQPGVPESFNVLIKELQSLALDVELIEDEHK